MNAKEVLSNVEYMIANSYSGKKWKIDEYYDRLGIFDWWKDYLTVTDLKQMQKFLKAVIARGFDGYVCFKVGVKYCSHGMWAYKEQSTTGYSLDGIFIFHSFRPGDNYWDLGIPNDGLLSKKLGTIDVDLRMVDEALENYK